MMKKTFMLSLGSILILLGAPAVVMFLFITIFDNPNKLTFILIVLGSILALPFAPMAYAGAWLIAYSDPEIDKNK